MIPKHVAIYIHMYLYICTVEVHRPGYVKTAELQSFSAPLFFGFRPSKPWMTVPRASDGGHQEKFVFRLVETCLRLLLTACLEVGCGC